jgi:hypothetical protein|tara:strand:+ start:47 stop:334 length:288 start_codon:yes stop_codon:yes gene_type:complete
MSIHPDDTEPIDEIEDGEIISEDEEDITLSDDDEYQIDEDGEDGEDGMDMVSLVTSLLATPDGDTICSALVNIGYQMETQNKILIKMLARLAAKN